MTFSLLTGSSRKINRGGNKIRLANMAKRRVTETSPPSATVPPKLEIMKIAKPKKSTIEVYNILTPASRKEV